MSAVIGFVVKIWDGVNDPIIGYLSDVVKCGDFGRRRPWILYGALPFAVFFVLRFVTVEGSQTVKVLYYLVMGILLDTFFTVVHTPYAAMVADLTDDTKERVDLNKYRFSFSMQTAVVTSTIMGFLISPAGFFWAALVVGVGFVFLPAVIMALSVEERTPRSSEPTKDLGLCESFWIVFQNYAFVCSTMCYVLSWLVVQFVQANLALYCKYVVDAESMFGAYIGIILEMCFLSFFFWGPLIETYDLKTAYYAGGSIFTIALLMLYVVTPATKWLLWPISVIAGFGLGVCYLVPWSLLPDVIEEDELETGQRREGIFYGFFILVQKLGLGVGLAVSSTLLGSVGYKQPSATCGLNTLATQDTQNASVKQMLRVMVSFLPAGLMLLSFLPVYLYPITKEGHAATVLALEQRHETAPLGTEASVTATTEQLPPATKGRDTQGRECC